MASSDERVIELLKKKLEGTIKEEEQAELLGWADENPKLYHELTTKEKVFAEAFKVSKVKNEVFAKLKAEIPELNEVEHSRFRIVYWQKYAAAAVVILVATIGYLWSHSFFEVKSKKTIASADHSMADIPAPAGHRTLLKLSSGSTIDLDSAGDGSLGKEGNSNVVKLAQGEVNYKALNEKPNEIVFNSIYTKRGGEYQVVLEDGSRVWLNAESSLRFPTSFTGKDRVVELTGEGYFEVAKNPSKPFRVKIEDGSVVEVLGTHFNINAYNNEPRPVTTLLAGSVKLFNGSKSKLLKPGQQGYVLNAGNIEVKDGDSETATAWRDGIFRFRSADIETVMRELARWYDVDVKFEGQKTGYLLTAQVKRNHNASDVLKVLEISGYHFRIADRTIIVMP